MVPIVTPPVYSQENASVQAEPAGNIRTFGVALVLIETLKQMRELILAI
jgi:hypothetical protein